jgi:hypothetical protein
VPNWKAGDRSTSAQDATRGRDARRRCGQAPSARGRGRRGITHLGLGEMRPGNPWRCGRGLTAATWQRAGGGTGATPVALPPSFAGLDSARASPTNLRRSAHWPRSCTTATSLKRRRCGVISTGNRKSPASAVRISRPQKPDRTRSGGAYPGATSAAISAGFAGLFVPCPAHAGLFVPCPAHLKRPCSPR